MSRGSLPPSDSPTTEHTLETDARRAKLLAAAEAARAWARERRAAWSDSTAEPGEEPLTTARRELHEECGLTGGRWSELGAFWTTPGFSREYMHVFLAEGVERGEPAPEADEELEIVRHPAADVAALIPEIEDAKTLAGLLLYLTSRATTRGR